MLLIDTNVLVRCSQGRAIFRLKELVDRNVVLGTTDRNVVEMEAKLCSVFQLTAPQASAECARVLSVMHIVPGELYDDQEAIASVRLSPGGKSDWPLLAAALAFEADIWSDDRDFFGVGVPVWSSDNVLCIDAGGR